jgi:hypothetical protein
MISLLTSCCAVDSLPPLQENQIPTTWEQLWADYDPASQPPNEGFK